MPDDDSSPAPRPGQLSKTPSWIMLGFILGALFITALPRRQPAPAEPPSPAPEATLSVRLAAPREPSPLATIEAVFAEWHRHAVWSDDTTEVALWNVRDRAFSDFYEVRRAGDAFYFRSIPKLTRRVISRGKPLPESPLQFTETEDQYREWFEHGRAERPSSVDLRPRPPAAAESPVLARPTAAPSADAAPPRIEAPPPPQDLPK